MIHHWILLSCLFTMLSMIGKWNQLRVDHKLIEKNERKIRFSTGGNFKKKCNKSHPSRVVEITSPIILLISSKKIYRKHKIFHLNGFLIDNKSIKGIRMEQQWCEQKIRFTIAPEKPSIASLHRHRWPRTNSTSPRYKYRQKIK